MKSTPTKLATSQEVFENAIEIDRLHKPDADKRCMPSRIRFLELGCVYSSGQYKLGREVYVASDASSSCFVPAHNLSPFAQSTILMQVQRARNSKAELFRNKGRRFRGCLDGWIREFESFAQDLFTDKRWNSYPSFIFLLWICTAKFDCFKFQDKRFLFEKMNIEHKNFKLQLIFSNISFEYKS